jgi:hypothetical protein
MKNRKRKSKGNKNGGAAKKEKGKSVEKKKTVEQNEKEKMGMKEKKVNRKKKKKRKMERKENGKKRRCVRTAHPRTANQGKEKKRRTKNRTHLTRECDVDASVTVGVIVAYIQNPLLTSHTRGPRPSAAQLTPPPLTSS